MIPRVLLFSLALSLFSKGAHAWTLEFPDEQGWGTNNLTFVVNYSNCSISQDALNTAIDSAVSLWNSVGTSSMKVIRGGTTTDTPSQTITDSPAILCDTNMTADIGSDANYIPGSTTSRKGSHNEMNYSMILLNSESGKYANISNLNAVELADVIAHEMGHSLGLGHSSLQEALMYYNSSAKTELNLAQDDADGVTYLYPRQEPMYGQFMGCGTLAVVGRGRGKHGGGGNGGSGGFPGAGAAVLAMWIGTLGAMTWAFKQKRPRPQTV